MRCLTLTASTLLGVLTAVPLARADEPRAIDQLVSAAQIVSLDAAEVRQMLGDRDVNLIAVLQQVDVLNARAGALRDAMAAPGVAAAAWTPAQADALERARAATGTMLVLITNKARILADVDTAPANRRLLRDKAEGVARRAVLVEAQMARLRE